MNDLNGYAVTDRPSRLRKARKIEALLGGDVAGRDLLDLGAGSGVLSDYFQLRGARVVAADRDPATYRGQAALTVIDGETLPFPEARFDIIVFNHVIEHVGGWQEQYAILAQIRRVLRPNGTLYLAVPNKWALVEPHFRLPLLGALPRPLADMAVRLTGKGPAYDCHPPSRRDLLTMLRHHFAIVEDRSADAAAWVAEHELRGVGRVVAKVVPRFLLRLLRPVYPTFVVLCRPGGGDEG